MRFVCTLAALVVSAVLVSNLSAADQPQRGPGRGGPGRGQFSQVDMLVRGLELTDAQKEKIEALKKELEPKAREAGEKFRNSLTEDQRTAQNNARRAAMEAGKSFQEASAAGLAAAKLTDEQQKAQKALEAIQKELREKVDSILTPEQREQAKKRAEEFRNRKPRAKE